MLPAGDQSPAQCPFCGRRVEKSAFLPYYDGYACAECRASIMARRVGAYLFDQFVVTYVGVTVLLVIGIALVWALDLDVRSPVFAIAVLVAFFGSIGAWLAKDAWFNGRSPGKAVFGLRVVRVDNGRPISALGSFIRNLPLLIGLVPLIVGVQICTGSMRRWGTAWPVPRSCGPNRPDGHDCGARWPQPSCCWPGC